MNDVIIIGGGASGLVSAIYASTKTNKVMLLEKNNILGKKLLITGNGKCNYWNNNLSSKHYYTPNKEMLDKILSDKNKQEISSFFDKIGIIPKIRDDYYYPQSLQSTTIQTSLIKECQLSNIEIVTNCEVKKIEKENNIFILTTTNGIYRTRKIILSTGSLSCPKTGSTGDGYQILKEFGHQITNLLPALVQLKCNEKYLKDWHGIRADVCVTLLENNKKIKHEIGEIQLTNYGVSGICIFNLSSIVSRGLFHHKNEKIEINFLYPLNINDENMFIEFMNQRNEHVKNRTISDLLDSLLNYKLINLILKLSKINRDAIWNNIDYHDKIKLANYLTKFTINITGTNQFDTSQTTTGGVPLTEVNPETLESKIEKNIFITGELLDVDGECGGFNLAFAWITGMLAGRGSSND